MSHYRIGGVLGRGFSPGRPVLLAMAQHDQPVGPSFVERVRVGLDRGNAEARRAICKEIQLAASVESPTLEPEQYTALARLLSRSEQLVHSGDYIEAFAALVAHHRVDAEECRRWSMQGPSITSGAERITLLTVMLDVMPWARDDVQQMINTMYVSMKASRSSYYSSKHISISAFVQFLQSVSSHCPAGESEWIDATLRFATRWNARSDASAVSGKPHAADRVLLGYIGTRKGAPLSDDDFLSFVWKGSRSADFVALFDIVALLPAAMRTVRPLSCDGRDDSVRAQALRRLLLCPEDLTVTETTYICEKLCADDHSNSFAAYLFATPSLGAEQRGVVFARAARCVMKEYWPANFQGLWTQSSPTERMKMLQLLTPTQRGRFVVALLAHCGRSSRGKALAESLREQFGAGIDGDASLSFAVAAAAADFVHRDPYNPSLDSLELLEAYLLETKGMPTIRDFVGPFLDRYAEAPELIRELRYRYNMALAKTWNVPPLRSALLLYAVDDPIRTALGNFDADVTGKHIAASLRAIRPIHLLANGEHGQPDLDKLEGVRLGIVGKLLAAGWQRGAMPSVEQLRIALKEESSAHRGLLPLVTTPTKQYPFHLLLNAHHRLAALATLVADELLPVSVLHAIPLRQPRFSTTALLREAFPEGDTVLLSWLDLLAFYPPAVKLLVRHDIG